MPLGKLPVEVAHDILVGGATSCASAGIPVAGGHSIDPAEPIYGLAVVGTARPEHVRRNAGGRPDELLARIRDAGCGRASIVGTVEKGPPRIEVAPAD